MRNKEDYAAALLDDRTWRIRELSELVRACGEATAVRRAALARAIVPVLYAHWEGYFVIAANKYLEYIAHQKIKLSDLKDEFWAITIRRRFNHQQMVGDKNFRNFLLAIRSEPDALFKPRRYEKINAQSNLKSDVLVGCCKAVCIDEQCFSDYFDFIDKGLVDRRNFIAHGEALRFDPNIVPEYRDKVIELMRIAQGQFENAIEAKSYLK